MHTVHRIYIWWQHLGEWILNSYLPCRVRILQRGDTVVINKRYVGGSSSEHELEGRAAADGTIYTDREDHPGDYCLLHRNGKLEARDAEGVVFTANRSDVLNGRAQAER
jgi:hypothetical protein